MFKVKEVWPEGEIQQVREITRAEAQRLKLMALIDDEDPEGEGFPLVEDTDGHTVVMETTKGMYALLAQNMDGHGILASVLIEAKV